VLGFIGNLLVIVVVLASSRRRRSTTNVLVTGLAAADLIFIVICVPFTAVNYAIDVWPFGTVWCKVGTCVTMFREVT
jgi:allatostatin A receptor